MNIADKRANRITQLPPYLFAEIDRKKTEVQQRGMDIIDLGVGDPDLPTPQHIVKKMQEAVARPEYHTYPSYAGMHAFREAVANWYQKRFNVTLNPESEVLTLIGSKEGIAHVSLAFINPNDIGLYTSPGYPVYQVSIKFAGGNSYPIPLLEKNRFLPDLDAIPEEIKKKAKLFFLNYPNNPTGAVAEADFYEGLIAMAKKHEILICHDAPYTEMSYDGYRPMSFLEVPGAKDVGIEFHSLSKTYRMTGWRLGFAVGNRDAVQALGKVKSNIDSGAFEAVQAAGIEALRGDQACVDEMRIIYQGRRDLMVKALNKLGFSVTPPKATFYLWIKVPQGYTSAGFATKVLEETGIVITPGNGFGDEGEGYVRMALTVNENRLKEAAQRLSDLKF